ncbi:MAG: 50S ribosomal protein L24 [Gemmatimonadaceae bacterium]|nr:50S ribosomal protein L24 [Gemmatimonadaceae bacterium]
MRILKYRKTEGQKLAKRHAGNAVRVTTKITKGDTVMVMRGSDKGKTGQVMRVFLKTGRVLVQGINIVKRHTRATRPEETGGIIEKPAPVALSNVMLIDPKTGKATRIKARIDTDGTKERVSVKSGDVIPRNR